MLEPYFSLLYNKQTKKIIPVLINYRTPFNNTETRGTPKH